MEHMQYKCLLQSSHINMPQHLLNTLSQLVNIKTICMLMEFQCSPQTHLTQEGFLTKHTFDQIKPNSRVYTNTSKSIEKTPPLYTYLETTSPLINLHSHGKTSPNLYFYIGHHLPTLSLYMWKKKPPTFHNWNNGSRSNPPIQTHK